MDQGSEEPYVPPLYPPMDETGEVDLGLLEINLSLTPCERLEQLDRFLQFVEIARLARIKRYGYDPAADGDAQAPE